MHKEIPHIINILKSGGVILYPTDTIWGIGCDAKNPDAIEKVKQIKHRAEDKSLLILCEDMDSVRNYVESFPEIAVLIEKESKKPVTIIYPNIKNIPKELLAQDGSLGIRIPRFDFCIKLLKAFKNPIISTSANISGMQSPQSFGDISDKIKDSVDYIVKDFHEYKTPFTGSKIVKIDSEDNIIMIRE